MRKNFLMIGHSNMCDRGYTNQLPTFSNAAQIFVYQEDPRWVSQTNWQPNTKGVWAQAVDKVEPFGAVAGQCGALQLAFADRLAGYTGTEIGLVPHAEGGTTFANWIKWNRNNGEYGMALQRALWAQDQGTLSGIVIWLGENDCGNSTVANSISQNYSNLMSWLRVDLGNLTLPIVIVKPGPNNYENLPYWSTMLAQIQWLEGATNKMAVVHTDDIPPLAGDVHFSTSAYVQIGQRIADTMATLL